MQRFLAVASLVLVCRLAFAASPIYVDQNATGASDGSSWDNALTNLASAISLGNGNSREVWVARGTYVLTNSNGVQLGNNAGLYGGFAGTETELSQRDWVANPTVITGGGSNTLLRFGSNSRIDGFILRGGYSSSGAGAIQWGGIEVGNSTVTNCVFENNSTSSGANYGASLGITGSGNVIRGCIFRNHTVTAVKVAGSADFIDCIFEDNVREPDAHSGSLAMYVNGSSSSGHKTVNLIRCVFAGNHGKFAAVLTSYSGALVTATNCIFTGNSAEFDGGAVSLDGGAFTAINCVFYGNNSGRDGGAIWQVWTDSSVLDVRNCIFLGNTALLNGMDIYVGRPTVCNVAYSLTNQADFASETGIVTGDPLFVDPDGADNIPGTADDDFRIQAGSPCIDAGFDDGGLLIPATDFLGLGRYDDPATTNLGAGPIDFVDIGVFEFNGLDACLSLLIHGTATVSETAGAAVRASVSIPAALASDLLVELASSNTDRATVPASVTIPSGQTWVNIIVTPVDDGAIGGDHAVVITATAAGFVEATGTITVLDVATKTISVALPASASESDISVTGTVTIPGTWETDLIITLASNSMARLTVPATVTIPQGDTSFDFDVTIVNNTAIDGDVTVTVTASADGWTGDSAEIEVLDDESKTITLTLSQATVVEGSADSVTGTVTIPGTWGADLVVTLASENEARLTVPATVTIPQGQTSVAFDLTVIDNDEIDGDETLGIEASASGWTADSTLIEVLDDESQTIALTLSQATVVEGSADSVTGTVTIPGTWHEALVVSLSSNNPTRLTVHATVTIPQGDTSVDFDVTIVNNTVIDGDATVTVTASAAGWTGDSAEIEVLDDESQTITIELSLDEVAVNFVGEITGTVTIPGTWHDDLVINLTSSDPAILTVPATVTINAGEASADFVVTIAEDAAVQGSDTFTISASADGWVGDSAEIILTKAAKSSGGCAGGTGSASAMFGLLGLALMARRR